MSSIRLADEADFWKIIELARSQGVLDSFDEQARMIRINGPIDISRPPLLPRVVATETPPLKPISAATGASLGDWLRHNAPASGISPPPSSQKLDGGQKG